MGRMLVDLRSDTLTQPTEGMREAIARAEVGDDVFGEDPTVNALQARCVELSGKAAALFLPSGTMANLIACRVHTRPGDEVILERTSHLYRYEAGGFAAINGVSVALLDGARGLLRPEQLDGALRDHDIHQPVSRLLWLENTHNYGGGSCYSLGALQALRAAATARGLLLHIDGARIWNAMAAQGHALRDAVALCDSMSFCFSKGLGCPAGSVLVGSAEFVEQARKHRKMFGGGMRQAGVLAAAALYALDHHVARVADDHRRARQLAEGLKSLSGLSVEPAETNILFLGTHKLSMDAPTLQHRLEQHGVKTLALSSQRLRLVTHLQIDDAAVAQTIDAFASVLGRSSAR